MINSGFKVMSRAALALLAGGFALFWSDDAPVPSGSLIGQAEARIGRPATPMSYAGCRGGQPAGASPTGRQPEPLRQALLLCDTRLPAGRDCTGRS